MLKAKLDSVRKNKKGFSLVELIIVIAIMVALVAVMAPAYVKYVQKSHDAVVQAAAESALQFVKAEMADGTFTGTGKMAIYGKPNSQGKKYICVDWGDEGTDVSSSLGYNNFAYNPSGNVEGNGKTEFKSGCGVDEDKQIRSDIVYIITVYDNSTVSGHPDLQASMETDVNPENNP